MATFDPNDERLTAYVLGDDSLSADDRAAVAELLASDGEAQRFADELRAAASMVGAELSSEVIPASAPTASIETAVRAELGKPRRKSWLARREWAVAASLLVGVMGAGGYYIATRNEMRGARDFALVKTAVNAKQSATPAPAAKAGGFGSPFDDASGRDGGRFRANAPSVEESTETAAAMGSQGRPAFGTTPERSVRLSTAGQVPPAAGGEAQGLGAQPADAQDWGYRRNATTTETSATPHPDNPAAPAPKDVAWVEQPVLRQPAAPGVKPQSQPTKSESGRGEARTPPAEVEKLGRGFKKADDMPDVALRVDPKKVDQLAKVDDFHANFEGAKPAPTNRPTLALDPKPAAIPAEPAPVNRLPALRESDSAGAKGGKPIEGKLNPNVVTDKKVVADLVDGVQKESEVAQRSFEFRERHDFNREAYPVLKENDFLGVQQNPLSTFSIDVDTASYALARRFLNQNALPPPGAVRLEEFVNYFRYNYSGPTGETPFAAHLEIAECPWNPEHRLARIALKGREIDRNKRPPTNLVFLVDISGSMNEPNKLPLVKDSLKLLVDQLGETDRVAIAVYASGSGLVLDSTNGTKKAEIMYAIDNLRPSGSTNGAAGIQCAYDAAVKGFIQGGVNRVILCTDGDFNVGVTSDDELVKLITDKAKTGVYLSCLAVGEGNLQDRKMMELANKGNGNYGYLDSIKEAQKILVEQMSGTLVTIAKDVKIQVEFNPAQVSSYRLLGYEKRMLKPEDFKNDKKDAGEIGAGHTVTALYELVPAGRASPAGEVRKLKYQNLDLAALKGDDARSICTVYLRYKKPDGNVGIESNFLGFDEGKKYTQASEDFRFAAAAASFAMILRDSPYKGNANLAAVHELASAAKGVDPGGYRDEFLKLIEKAKELKK